MQGTGERIGTMETYSYRTRTRFERRKAPGVPDYHLVGLDLGYSSVKGMTQDLVYCFPNYARPIPEGTISLEANDENRILYRGEDGREWVVGEAAQELVDPREAIDSDEELFGRNRYYTRMFRVISETGMGLGLTGHAEGVPIIIKTGLPQKYLLGDTADLRESLAGRHRFSLKRGSLPWVDYDFEVDPGHIPVIGQPMGSLFSAMVGTDGKPVGFVRKLQMGNVRVIDGGFGTLDDISIQKMTINARSMQTFTEYGMKAVLQATSDEIRRRYGVDYPVYSMQKILREGKIKKFDRKTNSTSYQPFNDILEECSHAVCMGMLEKLSSIHDNFLQDDIIIITGGTGAAWSQWITEYFSKREGLEVMGANRNDPSLPYVFSNVRGYYMSAYQGLLRGRIV